MSALLRHPQAVPPAAAGPTITVGKVTPAAAQGSTAVHDSARGSSPEDGGTDLALPGAMLMEVSDTARQCLGDIADASAHMSTLIEALLEFARAGRAGVRTTTVDVEAVAREAGAVAEGATFFVALPGGGPRPAPAGFPLRTSVPA